MPIHISTVGWGIYLSHMRCLWPQGTVQCRLLPARTHFAGYVIIVVFIHHSRIPAARTANSQQPKLVYLTEVKVKPSSAVYRI